MTATAGSTPKVTGYTYNNALRLSTVKRADDGANQTTYNYDPVGLRVGLTLPNGINITYGYNSLNRLTNITQKNSGGTVLASYAYTLDPVGNRTKVDEFGGNYNQWLYDDSYRLISETRKVSSDPITTTTFAYDKTGNRSSITTTVGASNTVTNSLYNELDQLLSEGSKLYSYDKRGNLAGVSGGTYYTWDVMDRLIGASVSGGSASYLYDPDGHRVKQTSGANVTNFLLDKESAYGDVTLETDGSNVITANYTIGQGCPICDVSGLLSQNKGGTVSYFLKDGQGSVRNLTNSSGVISENYRYDAFGNLQGFSGTPSTKYLYTGQQFDSLTSLYDLRARYYNPIQARFLSQDSFPVSFNNPIELNRYGYTANNPVNASDPSGEAALMEYGYASRDDQKKREPALKGIGQSATRYQRAIIYPQKAISLQRAVYSKVGRLAEGEEKFTIAFTKANVNGESKGAVSLSYPNSKKVRKAFVEAAKEEGISEELIFIGKKQEDHAEAILYENLQKKGWTSDIQAIGISNSRGPCIEICQKFLGQLIEAGANILVFWIL